MTRRTLFLIGILFELVAIFGLFLPYEYRLATGTSITLETIPVDPTSIFRGSYVTLDYVVGRGAPRPVDESYVVTEWYVTLEKKGDVFERVSLGKTKPVLKDGQVCLVGYSDGWSGFVRFPDIAQYFADEKLAKELEQVRNDHRLLVDAVVDGNCKATILGLRVGVEVPAAQAERERNPEILAPQAAPVQ